MIIDRLVPGPDAVRTEHAVVTGAPEAVYPVVTHADFLRAVGQNPAVKALFATRSAGERLIAAVAGRDFTEPPEPEALRLADMTGEGEWVILGEDPPGEVAFGVVGRFWGGETAWERIEAQGFESFAEPGLAKIACNFSLRPYGAGRTLVSYEARTVAFGAEARRGFLRYWRMLAPLVGVVMRSQLRVIGGDAEAACGSR